MVFYHLVKFDSHRCSNRRDIMFPVCHVINQDQVTGQVTVTIGIPQSKSPHCQVWWSS